MWAYFFLVTKRKTWKGGLKRKRFVNIAINTCLTLSVKK